MSNKIDVEYFIEQFVGILPVHEQIRTDKTYISGKELKLTGVKLHKGEALKDEVFYELEVPVLKAIALHDGEPVLKIIDHKHRLRVAWLKNGLEGIYEYLQPFLGPVQLAQVRKTFMSVRNKPLPQR